MTDREKLIRGMEDTIGFLTIAQLRFMASGNGDSNTIENCIASCEYALAMIKEQEPRIMTYEEIKDNMGVPVWVEYADNENWNGYGVPTSDYGAYIMIYGANAYCAQNARSHNVKWRCWTSRHSPEQMRETPWEGDSDVE